MFLQSSLELIGNTPLVKSERYAKACGMDATLLVKLEKYNLTGSSKDRIALAMICAAEDDGRLQAGGTIAEPSSGNVGIAIAAAGALKGYRVIITMPQGMSAERAAVMRAYGATVVFTEREKGMTGAIDKAREIAKNTGAVMLGQFENPVNPQAHFATTGREIWRDTGGVIDAFVAGVGTGGTVSGVGRYLKEQNPDVRIVAAEPSGSPVLSGGKAGRHKIQGIGAGFVPATFDRSVIDEIITVSDDEAYCCAREFARLEGILVGISSGAALCAARKTAARHGYKTVVALLPDTGERYLSSDLFG